MNSGFFKTVEYFGLRFRISYVIVQTMSSFRSKSWPTNGSRDTKRDERECIRCFNFQSVFAQQILVTLQRNIVQTLKPFQNFGNDFCCSHWIISSRLRKALVIKEITRFFDLHGT